MHWDVCCRVVDNHGDLGVCWRLAADLASRGETVRLWVDDASALAWMAPHGACGVGVRAWPQGAADAAEIARADVVIAAFGCDLPDAMQAAMRAAHPPPLWIDLEYLSAEGYVDRSHGLPSPQRGGPGDGLVQWFFYPGYTAASGGLLREPDLAERQRVFDGSAWLASIGVEAEVGERTVSLFCYEPQVAFGALLDELSSQPTLVLAAPGAASRLLHEHLGGTLARGSLRGIALPWLSQRDHDHLLWASELNFVRGEDSWVRAQWAGRPFVWQAYAQDDRAHVAKLEAFMDRFVAAAPPALASALRRMFARWNGLRDGPFELAPFDAWRAHAEQWRDALASRPDLATQLLGFVAAKR